MNPGPSVYECSPLQLDVFFKSENAHITINDFKKAGIKIYADGNNGLEEKFLFHIQLLLENKFISNKEFCSDNLKRIGIHLLHGNSVTIQEVDIRLTQKGHDFAKVINNKDVLAKLKSNFMDQPFDTIFEIGKELLKHVAKKKLDDIMSG
jgi:hypothetical protein